MPASEGTGRHMLGAAMAGLVQRAAQAADDQAANQPRITEANIRLGRMHVDVDQRRVERQEERGHGVPVAGKHVGESAADRPTAVAPPPALSPTP